MDSIEIKRNGVTVSRVHFGTRVSEVAGYFVGKSFLIYDVSAETYALELARAVSFSGIYALRGVSEEGKTMATIEGICRWLLGAGADRDATLVAVGGGILSDMAGFAAAVYKRGIKSAYVPTTLLAQVDAAIGGKTGVNMDSYKNIIGVFKQPEFTYVCPEVLESLPEPVFRAGLAELLKTFIIDNGRGDRISRLLESVSRINTAGGFANADAGVRAEFGELVARAAAVKAGIVTRDERESGERRKLNLGHTFAHAIEHNANAGDDPKNFEHNVNAEQSNCAGEHHVNAVHAEGISHGEAVAIGLAMAARLSVRLGIADRKVEADVIKALEVCGLPTECPFPVSALTDAMRKDKKAEDGIIHVILIRSFGDVIVRDMTASQAASLLA